MDINEVLQKTITQEEILRFQSFDSKDAFEIGKLTTELAAERGYAIAVGIRKMDGQILFQHACEGAVMFNDYWMTRKFNTVALTGKSTLRLHAEIVAQGENTDRLQPWFVNVEKYSTFGGGFPIFVNGVGLFAVFCVSGLDHESDHGVIVEVLSKYLQISDIPMIKTGDIEK